MGVQPILVATLGHSNRSDLGLEGLGAPGELARIDRPIPRETAKEEGGDGRPGVVAWTAVPWRPADTAADGHMARVTGDRVRYRLADGAAGTVPTDATRSADPASDRRSVRAARGGRA